MHIVYVLDDLNASGGIQVVTRAKASVLAKVPGNRVTIVAANDSSENAAPLPESVSFISLGINYYEDDWKGFFYVLKGIFVKRRRHAVQLKETLERLDPDVVVSVGQSEKFILPCVSRHCSWATVREFHFARTYRRAYARMSGRLSSRILAFLSDWYEFHWYGQRYDAVVLLTHQDRQENWGNRDDLYVIPNPCVFHTEAVSSCDVFQAVTMGRLIKVKGFDLLVRAWVLVVKERPEWKLEIWGDGEEYGNLEQLIRALNLEDNVYLKGIADNAAAELMKSSLFVFPSLFEGFGMVLVEAMTCGLPCVSFECPCGPRDLLGSGREGILVPTGDVEKLAEGVVWMIEHPAERLVMAEAARKKAEDYSLKKILPQWMNLFQKLVREKKSPDKGQE